MVHWEELAVIASCVVAILAFLDSWARRRRDDRDDIGAAVRRVEDRLTRLEIDQFGSNHGGLREQVNKIDVKVSRIAECVAEMRGEIRSQ